MTTRIEEFSDTVTSAITPVTTNITGATGAPGRAFQVDEFTDFSEVKRAEIEAYGTPSGTHGVVTATNPYVVVIQIDNRSAAERLAGPAPLNSDLSRKVIEWNGASATGGGATWFDYGQFTGLDGGAWHTGDGVPADSLGADGDMYLNVTTGSGRGDVYQKASGTWGSPIVNIAQTASQAINVTTASGLSGDGTTGTPLALETDGTTISQSVSGIKLSDTLNNKLAQYPTPMASDDGQYFRVNSLGNVDLIAIANATTMAAGFMSTTDKEKLDKYTSPAAESSGGAGDSADAGKLNQVTDAGVMNLIIPTKALVGLSYVPDQWDSTGATNYVVGNFVFYEGVNYRALVDNNSTTTPDMDSTNWRSLGGGHILLDGTSGTDVELPSEPNLRFLGNVQVADNPGNSSTDITITGESPADFNLFSDGNLDFALASSYTTTGNGTFAISSANALRGDRSGNWTAVSNASTVTSPSIPIPLGYRDELVEFSLIYRSTDEVTLELLNGSTVINTSTLDAFTETNGSRKIRVFQKLRSDQTAISFRFSASSVTTFTFDDVIITDNFNSTGQLTNVRRFTSTRPPFDGTATPEIYNRIIDWGDADTRVFNTTEGSGGALLTYANDTTNGSSWTVNEDCRVTGFYTAAGNAANVNLGWSVNGTPGTDIQDLSIDEIVSFSAVSATGLIDTFPILFDVKAGDVLRCHVSNLGIPIAQQRLARLEIQAEVIETQDVTVYNAQTSAANEFSARFTGGSSPVLTSQSANFVQTIAFVSTGVYQVTFVPGFFSEVPAVTGTSEDTQRNFSVIVDSLSITGFQYQIEVSGGGADSPAAINVSRQGSDVRSQTANFTIPVIDADINEFSARFDGGATTVDANRIKSQSSPFVQTIVEDPGDGRFIITWVAGVFSVIPSVVAGLEVGVNSDKVISAFDVTTTGCKISIESAGDQAASAGDFNLTVQKQGTDYVAPKVIQVPTQAITTVRGIDTVITATVDATAGSSSDPNRIMTQSVDWIQSIAQTGTAGEFLVTFTPGFFTATPQITGNAIDRSTALGITILTNVNMTCNVNAGVGNINFYLVATPIDINDRPLEEVTVQTPLIRPNEPFLFQRKDLGTAISGQTLDITDLTFNNLEIGKIYRIGGNMLTVQSAGQDANLSFHSATAAGGTKYGEVGFSANSVTGGNYKFSPNFLFTAVSTVMVSRINVGNGGTLTTENFITLEELPYHEATTKWT